MKTILGFVGLIYSVPSEIYEIGHFLYLVQNVSKYTTTQWGDATFNNTIAFIGLAFLIWISFTLLKLGNK
jgi:hypothetical protein